MEIKMSFWEEYNASQRIFNASVFLSFSFFFFQKGSGIQEDLFNQNSVSIMLLLGQTVTRGFYHGQDIVIS